MSHDSHPNELLAAVTSAMQNFTLSTGALTDDPADKTSIALQVTPRPDEGDRHIMTAMAQLNGHRCVAIWNGKEGVVDLSVQLAPVVQHIDPYGDH